MSFLPSPFLVWHQPNVIFYLLKRQYCYVILINTQSYTRYSWWIWKIWSKRAVTAQDCRIKRQQESASKILVLCDYITDDNLSYFFSICGTLVGDIVPLTGHFIRYTLLVQGWIPFYKGSKPFLRDFVHLCMTASHSRCWLEDGSVRDENEPFDNIPIGLKSGNHWDTYCEFNDNLNKLV